MFTIANSGNSDIDKIKDELNLEQDHILKAIDNINNKVQHIFIFEANADCISLAGIIKYFIQSIYQTPYFTS